MKERLPSNLFSLTEAEYNDCRLMTKIRLQRMQSAGLVDLLVDQSKTKEGAMMEGFAAEKALSKFLGLQPVGELRPDQVSGSIDFISNKGHRIDAKTTTHQKGRLIVRTKAAVSDCDVYFLLINLQGLNRHFIVSGWCFSPELIRPENKMKLKNWVYGLDQDKLRSLREWRNETDYYYSTQATVG